MIKIIKEGKLPKKTKTIYTVTCPKCFCEFECDDSDLIIEKGIGGTRSVICPCCGNIIMLMTGDFGNEDSFKTRIEELPD